jgi:hypothetical protein
MRGRPPHESGSTIQRTDAAGAPTNDNSGEDNRKDGLATTPPRSGLVQRVIICLKPKYHGIQFSEKHEISIESIG